MNQKVRTTLSQRHSAGFSVSSLQASGQLIDRPKLPGTPTSSQKAVAVHRS